MTAQTQLTGITRAEVKENWKKVKYKSVQTVTA